MDALGTTWGLTDSSQSATDGLRFDGFGLPVSRSGSTPTPFGFVGGSQYQTDGDTGLLLLGHRYYDASVGRFLTVDPAKAGGNWYAYCDNNPLKQTDPSGYMLAAGAILAGGLRLAAGAEILGGGPEDPAADVVALGILAGTVIIAGGVYLATKFPAENDPPWMNDPDPSTNPLRGKNPADIPGEIPPEWGSGEPSKKGGGTIWRVPGRPGDQVQVSPGDPASNDPEGVHQGPYARVSKGGVRSGAIPLAGNDAL